MDKLKYSPLIEAVCEFRFASEAWDWTIPGRLYDAISRDYPERSQIEGQLQIMFGPAGGPVNKLPERVQMKRRDGVAMVQVGPNLLVINHLRPYSDWGTFLPMILQTYQLYTGIAGPEKVIRIGLRYINKIEMGSNDYKLESVTTLPAKLPAELDKPLEGLFQRYDYAFEDHKATMVVQLATQREKGDLNFVLLDFDVGSAVPHVFTDLNSVRDWLNAAHDMIDRAFVSSVNPVILEKWKRGEK